MKIGRVYKIICAVDDVVYVGSTFNTTRDRFNQHKRQYKECLKGLQKNISIYSFFEKYGIDNFKMILIKEYEVEDRKHLQAYEQLWINKCNCINKIGAFSILRRNKIYRRLNENNINKKNYMKEYYQKTKEHKKDYDKERRKTKYDCECGSMGISFAHKSDHNKSKKHQAYINSN